MTTYKVKIKIKFKKIRSVKIKKLQQNKHINFITLTRNLCAL